LEKECKFKGEYYAYTEYINEEQLEIVEDACWDDIVNAVNIAMKMKDDITNQ